MTQQQQTTNGDLSHIHNLAALNAEIRATRLRMKSSKPRVNELVARLPQETVKKTVTTAVSLVLAKKIAFLTASVVNKGLKVLFNNKETNKEEHNLSKLIKSAAKLGFFTSLKVAFNKAQNKKATEVV